MESAPVITRRRSVRQFVPPQHGAWAMLLLPYVIGVIAAGFRRPDLPLLGAWLAGYLLSYYAFQAIKSRRPRRYVRQLQLYGLSTLLLATPVVVARPAVLLYAPAFAVLVAVNAWYAHRRRERAFLNDLAAVTQSCLMVFVVATVAGAPPSTVLTPFTLVLLYLTGTILYVKTMIRERDSQSYRTASAIYHAAALAAVVTQGPLPTAVFTLLLARAWLLPGRSLTPKQVGLLEIAASTLVLLATVT
ncbi:YwiC-like family protein [Actinoplanes sp. NPDC048796]|uniref:YwiC-like family protein n=1 Tax=Actinoplanes sp. NPDC048796 TaxID=3155640 RepID=UPI0033D6C786